MIKEKYFGIDHIEISYSLHTLSRAHLGLGNYKKAKELLKKALLIKKAYFGANHIETANTQHALGLVYLALGNYNKSYTLIKKALTNVTVLYG